MKKIIFVIFISMICAFTYKAVAIPASPYPVKYVLPDGQTIMIQIQGDEYFHWVSTTDGYTLLLNAEGYYEYAVADPDGNLVCSGVRAHDMALRMDELSFLQALPKNLSFSENQLNMSRQLRKISDEARAKRKVPSVGDLKLLLLLVQFQDTVFKPQLYNSTNPQQAFTDLMNQPGYHKDGFTGSIYDYFYDNSCGKMKIHTDVYGPYTASRKLKYYGEDLGSHPCPYAQELIKEAIDSAYAQGVNFSDYDNDKDGILDGLYVIYAGTDQSQTTNKIELWAHEAYFETGPYTVGDVKIEQYSCSSELWKGAKRFGISGIGPIAHEFSHSLGIMDYYDTDKEVNGSAMDPTCWDLMALGSHNNEGRTPPIHNGYSREKLGWQKVKEINTAGIVVLPKPIAGDSNTMQTYKINTFRGAGEDAEYFLFENRQLAKWDSGLPKAGLLVWKIDQKIINDKAASNKINATSKINEQGILVVPADGLYNRNRNKPSTIFSDNKTSFTNATAPDMLSNDNTESYYVLANIGYDNEAGTITLEVAEDSTVNYIDACDKTQMDELGQLFDDVINGEEINFQGWTTQDLRSSNLKWKGAKKDGRTYAEINLNEIAASNPFDSWLISPLIVNENDGKNKHLVFMQNASDWKATYSATVRLLHCKGTKAYYEDLKVEGNFPSKLPLWKTFSKKLPVLEEPYAIAFVLSGTSAETNTTYRIDSVFIQVLTTDNQKDVKAPALFSITPNPVHNTLHIIASEEIERVMIYDLLGQLVKEEKVMNKEKDILVESLSTGIYLVQCRYVNGAVASEKMIKQ